MPAGDVTGVTSPSYVTVRRSRLPEDGATLGRPVYESLNRTEFGPGHVRGTFHHVLRSKKKTTNPHKKYIIYLTVFWSIRHSSDY